MGVYDLPAVINYISEKKNDDKIIYIGHSQGTTMFYIFASKKPKISTKIQAMYSLSPIAFMGHTKILPLRIFAHLNIDLVKVI